MAGPGNEAGRFGEGARSLSQKKSETYGSWLISRFQAGVKEHEHDTWDFRWEGWTPHGSRRGIGLAAAKAFAEAGASVVLVDHDEELIGKATEEIHSAGYNAIGVTCDVTDKAQVADDSLYRQGVIEWIENSSQNCD